MSGTRLNIDFFFKDMTPKEVNETFPQLLQNIRGAKKRASIVNEGELTVKAVYHICRHDDGGSCDPDQEI